MVSLLRTGVWIGFPVCESSWIRFFLEKIHRILWDSKVHCRIHNSSPPVPILSQMEALHTLPSWSFKIRFDIIFAFRPRFSRWFLSFSFPTKTLGIALLSLVCHITRLSYHPWFDHSRSTNREVELLIMLLSSVSSCAHLPTLRARYLPLHPVLTALLHELPWTLNSIHVTRRLKATCKTCKLDCAECGLRCCSY